MTQPFMRAYSRMVIRNCHKRGVHAMGGMAAQIPVKGDDAKNEAAFEKVRVDKLREAEDGHDGTWVAHPALVPVAKQVFDAAMPGKNQIDSGKQAGLVVTEAELTAAPEGPRTEHALRHNLRVGVQYLEAWLRGSGAVPLYDLMEDAATAEISRAQIWQWLRHGVVLDTGKKVTAELVRALLDEEMKVVAQEIGADRVKSGRFPEAQALLLDVATAVPMKDFLTLPAYEVLARLDDR
jgi:malate synthase